MPQGPIDQRDLESLALRRLPLAIGILLAFLAGAFPVELYYYPSHSGTYLSVLVLEAGVSALAYVLASRIPSSTRLIAASWGAAMALCITGYYPLVGGDATLAMTALVCLVAAMPAMIPLDWYHQSAIGGAAILGLVTLVLLGQPSSLPLPYLVIALASVLLISAIAAHSIVRFRLDAAARESSLREARDELGCALARAEHAVQMRSQLVANVSHEFRTPVHVIIGYADMLLDEDTDPPMAAHLIGRVREKAIQLDELISQLLDLSRLSCGRLERAVGDIDVASLLEDVADGTRRLIGRRPIRVRVECGVRSLRSDPVRVRQIVSNLATNAAKFTTHGEVRFVAYPAPGGVVLQVRDTGCGIPPEKHESIFGAFEQVAPRSNESGGIGLGLAIVKQLADLLDGSVEVASAPGHGATFTVHLPHLPATGDPLVRTSVSAHESNLAAPA
jgi:signal transduction histidine kinase